MNTIKIAVYISQKT